MITLEIPSKYWQQTRTRSFTKLRGRSKNFNEELRLWLRDNNGYAMWSQIRENEGNISVFMVGSGTLTPFFSRSYSFRNTWIAYFSTEEDAMHFKLTWL